MKAALRMASWPALLAAVAFYLSSQIISALKWKILLSAVLRRTDSSNHSPDEAGSTPHRAPSLAECYRFYLIGMFCNLWLPTSIGGDAARATLAGKRWGDFALAASSILIERMTGLFALLAIGAGGWLFQLHQTTGSPLESGGGATVISLAFNALLAIGVLLALLCVLRKLAFVFEARSHSTLISKWAKIHRTLDMFASRELRPALLQALGLSFVFQSTQILLNIFLARAVGLNLPSGVFAWLVPSLGIAAMIPLGIGGLGVREGAALALLRSTPLPPNTISTSLILAWSLLWQATLWLSGLPGALAYFIQIKERAP